MEIVKNRNENELRISVEGRLDTSTAPALEQEINDNLEGVESLILDFKGLEYISSAGLRVLLGSQKAMSKQGSMKLCNVNVDVMEILEITRFSDILTIE
ncbi:MAG: STAS domain-containing protein [Mogibacterium sp.]|nr:STAS domain-containing protein [Mogibacterium sp.]